jgi:hypothetical protein
MPSVAEPESVAASGGIVTRKMAGASMIGSTADYGDTSSADRRRAAVYQQFLPRRIPVGGARRRNPRATAWVVR